MLKLNLFVSMFFVFLFSGCSDHSGGSLPVNDDYSLWTPEERQANAPNSAFEAVYKKAPGQVEELLESNPELFSTKNSYGRTPLMAAIMIRQKDMARSICEKMPFEDLKAKDNEGRGHISYASEYGMVEIIELVAEKYKNSLQYGLARFHNIDFLNNQGQHALFFAADAATAQTLKDYWMQWNVTWSVSWTFWSGFYKTYDDNAQNFLHTAARDNRFEVINWGVGEVCADYLLHDSEYLAGIPSAVAGVIDFLGGALQRAPLVPDDLVNA